MIAYGINFPSTMDGLETALAAKTTELARHYEKGFGAVLLPAFESLVLGYLIADETAKRIFFTYLI